MNATNQHVHLVTGRLAEPALREVVARLTAEQGGSYTIEVLPITVAALMTCRWVANRLAPPPEAARVVLPGYCQGELALVAAACGRPVERGPKDLRELPRYLGSTASDEPPLDQYDIEIVAEINHAPRLPLATLVDEARALRASGADVIDLGCVPGSPWGEIGPAVRALREAGCRVSVDSLDPAEIAPAAAAGAELVLSVNRSNREHAPDWGVEVVAIPDEPGDWNSLADTVDWLGARGVPFRIDPILEPIGYGFAASLARYFEARRRWPQAELLMGIGNLSELTDVDSAGVNLLLLAICQELRIRSVLTTQVIPWCQSAVRECDLARRLVHRAVTAQRLPKHLEPRLVLLRDPEVTAPTPAELDDLAARLKDPSYRLFAAAGALHLVSAGLHLADRDPYRLFAQLLARQPRNLDLGHAFYLGYELAKATTALTLGKQYRQDEALNWGFLTEAEPSLGHRRLEPSADDTSPAEDA